MEVRLFVFGFNLESKNPCIILLWSMRSLYAVRFLNGVDRWTVCSLCHPFFRQRNSSTATLERLIMRYTVERG
jgi:hypothetical protein